MKAVKFLFLVASVGVLFTFSNCGGDPKPSESVSDQQLAKLSKTWKFSSVTLDGTPVTTPSYAAFQLALTGTKGQTSFGYTTTGRPSLSAWKSSGTWKFGTEPTTMMVRDAGTTDELAMNYVVSGTSLTISFNFQNSNGGYPGRVDVVKGAWVFNFTAL